jgi:hypothetical protein
MFTDIAATLPHVEQQQDFVHNQLLDVMDADAARLLRLDGRAGPEHFVIAGQHVEVEPGRDGHVVAYITSNEGERLISCDINARDDTAGSMARMLGLEGAKPDEIDDLVRVVRSMAA